MIKGLEKNSKEIINQFKERALDVEKYIKIKDKYDKGCNTEKDKDFQKLYKSFYRMRMAGLTDEYFDKYFKILNNRAYNKKSDLFDFLIEMDGIKTRRGRNSLQFSFATKLLHSANNDLPIFDQYVGNFFRINVPNDLGQDISSRARNRQDIYNELCLDFDEFLLQKKTRDFLEKVRSKISIPKIETISDAKFLDFVIWINGQIDQK